MKRCLNCGKVVNGNTKSCYFCGSLDLIYEEDNTNNLNNEDNGKTFIFFSLLLGFLFLILSIINNNNGSTSKQFNNYMKKEKYSIVNLLDNNAYKKYDYAYKASNNNYSIIYLFSNDNDLINESYENVKNSIIKSGIINNKIDLTVKKFSKYSVYDNKNYQVVIKNDKSIIFTTTDIKNKKDIDKLLKELNYDYSELSSIFLVLSILIFSILYLVSLFKLFKKSGRNPFLSLIPIYNLYIYADISVGNKKLFFLFLIPIVNIFMFIYSVYKLSKLFGKNTIYALTSSLLCFIYFPLLAFDDSEYLGVKRI